MRRKLMAFAACCAAAWLPAAEPARPAGAPDDDPIAAAKREFDKTKADRAGGDQPGKSGLPKYDLPPMPQPGGAPLPAETQKKKRAGATEKKSGNWLLEAMEKKADTREGRSRADGSARNSDESVTSAEAKGAEDGRAESVGEAIVRDAAGESRAEKKGEEREPRRTEPAPNPLARYMSEWMTPQDYTLLKPVVDASARGAEATGIGANATAAPSGPAGPAGTGDFISESRANARASFSPPTAQENPYLQLLHAPPPSAPIISAPAMPPNPAPVAIAPPGPAPESPKSNIPDFAKPLDDQKYFKQLKRF